ncbi:neurofilament medium polypeptide-like [Pollicipes pollicipes]|uniref:neurofilament medium polypeptide-like n=1 Tax=Pollicipes pollicipes TaxID=41117 RepID=UPI0018849BD5|nr:neurofilament medium polypeptide-like [Pollicipes pollicipes]
MSRQRPDEEEEEVDTRQEAEEVDTRQEEEEVDTHQEEEEVDTHLEEVEEVTTHQEEEETVDTRQEVEEVDNRQEEVEEVEEVDTHQEEEVDTHQGVEEVDIRQEEVEEVDTHREAVALDTRQDEAQRTGLRHAKGTLMYKPSPALSHKPALHHPEPQYGENAKPFVYKYASNDQYTGTNFAKKRGFVIAAVLAVAAAAPAPETPGYKPAPAPYHPAPPSPAPSYKPASYHPEPQYKEEAKPFAYDYAVNDHYTGTNFAKKEESDGHNTQGYYSVALPDGRVQHVKYVADDYGGYNAQNGNKSRRKEKG